MTTKINKSTIGLIIGLILLSLIVSGVAIGSTETMPNPVQMASMPNPPKLWIVAGEPSDLVVRNRPPESFLLNAPQTANITVTYAGTWDPQAQAAFEYAVSIWETQITSSIEIKVEANWEDLGSGILGGAGAEEIFRDFPNAPVAGTWYPVALANKLAGTDLFSGADIGASFNSAFSSWYFGTDGNPPANKYDFASVVLHELGHGLGFFGSMSVGSLCGGSGVGCWGFGTSYPAIYDRFTENGVGTALLAFPNNSTQLAAQLTSNDIFFDGPNANAANGNSRVPLYAPGAWQQGSSYSHLAESFNSTVNALMTYSIGPGEVEHAPGPVMQGMFHDMGWMIDAGATATPTSTPTKTPTPTNTPTPTPTPMPVEVAIDPLTGGNLTFSDYEANQVTIHVPGNAVSQTISLLYTPLGKQTPPDGLAFAGTAFTLDAYLNDVLLPGFVFSRSVTVTIEYSNLDIANIRSEDSLKLYTLNQPGNVWDDAANTCVPPSTYARNVNQNWLETQICHLSTFSLFGERQDLFLPIIMNPAVTPSPGNWTTIYNETFEGDFPGSWSLFEFGTTTGYVWGKRNCQAFQGSFSGWGVGGGVNGSALGCNANYPNGVETLMIYGPFSLANSIEALVDYMLWLHVESAGASLYDGFCVIASPVGGTNPDNYDGWCYHGNSSGWVSDYLNLADIYEDGTVDLTGDTSVWLGLVFFSDSTVTYPGGVYVDNLVIRRCASGCATELNVQNNHLNAQMIPWREIQLGTSETK